MLPQYVIDSIPKVKLLVKESPSNQSTFSLLCAKSDTKLIKTILDFALNALFNNSIQLSVSDKASLAPHKRILLFLCEKKTSLQEKKLLIGKKGHLFVVPLLKSLLPKLLHHVKR